MDVGGAIALAVFAALMVVGVVYVRRHPGSRAQEVQERETSKLRGQHELDDARRPPGTHL